MKKRGGRRPGAGRRPGKYGSQVPLTTGVSEAVKAFLVSTGNASRTIEEMVRRTKAFREWRKEQ